MTAIKLLQSCDSVPESTMGDAPQPLKSMDPYYQSRYTPNPDRTVVWREIVRYLQPYVARAKTVVDLRIKSPSVRNTRRISASRRGSTADLEKLQTTQSATLDGCFGPFRGVLVDEPLSSEDFSIGRDTRPGTAFTAGPVCALTSITAAAATNFSGR